jgi:CheY-like chemotaxis protein
MFTKSEFYDLVIKAYHSLYDFAYLKNHPLNKFLIDDKTLQMKERGWQMHNLLLEVLEELRPADAPPLSKEWRWYRLLILRYVEVLQPQAVADQLAISRRQYYREHAIVTEKLAELLWERCIFDVGIAPAENSAHHTTDMMKSELQRINQQDSYGDVLEVINRVLHTVEKILHDKHIHSDLSQLSEIPVTSIGQNVLRQVLLGILGIFAEYTEQNTLHFGAMTRDQMAYLDIQVQRPFIVEWTTIEIQLAGLREMLQVARADIMPMMDKNRTFIGVSLALPVDYDCTVLTVDDNEDTLALYKRFLTPNRYRVVSTSNTNEVLSLVLKIVPDIIILDLMMPNQDGWDLLQLLNNHPETAAIPIVICSVLKQKQLALSMGAKAFLEKPFTEELLVATLNELLQIKL